MANILCPDSACYANGDTWQRASSHNSAIFIDSYTEWLGQRLKINDQAPVQDDCNNGSIAEDQISPTNGVVRTGVMRLDEASKSNLTMGLAADIRAKLSSEVPFDANLEAELKHSVSKSLEGKYSFSIGTYTLKSSVFRDRISECTRNGKPQNGEWGVLFSMTTVKFTGDSVETIKSTLKANVHAALDVSSKSHGDAKAGGGATIDNVIDATIASSAAGKPFIVSFGFKVRNL